MTERHERNAKLIAETFHGEWTSGHAAELARIAARHARRRRHLRRFGAIAAVGAVLIAWAVLDRPLLTPTQSPSAVVARNQSPRPAPVARGYEVISDEQLLAELKDRPLLMVRDAKGARSFVLLENSE